VKLEDDFVKGTVGAGGITNFRVVFVCWGVVSECLIKMSQKNIEVQFE